MKKLFIWPDTHAPYHDEAAWSLTMKVAKWFKPNIGIHIGDLHDCYAISNYPKDPSREFNHDGETASARALRVELDELEPERKVFCVGNHEDRLPRYLMKRAPELFADITVDKLLQLSANGWEIVPYQDSIKIGSIYYSHDAGSSGGKYPTRIALETFQHSVVVGHNHRMEYHVIGDATGDHQVGAQFGWLGDIDRVDYLHRIKVKRFWSQGFGIGYMDEKTGVTHLVPVPIVDYKVNVAGKEFTV